MANRDLEFLFEIATLRNVPRGWKQHFVGEEVASVLEHTVRVMLLALIIARNEGGVDEGKVLKMALIHDLQEARISDLNYVPKVYITADEDRAAADMLHDTSIPDYLDVFREAEAKESVEARIVKDADNLDIDLELKEIENTGSPLPKKWAPFRRAVRDNKLYTKTAKKIWDEIQTADVDTWHLTMNKWLNGKDKII